jgi:hypothetical protein
MKDVGILNDHLVYVIAISNILWPFGIFYGHFGIFFTVLVCRTKKNLATLLERHFVTGNISRAVCFRETFF